MNERSLANILIVEDDPVQIRLYSKALRGYRLTCVTSGSAALTQLGKQVPDVILLDHVLADGEYGTDFLPKLKDAAAHVPIIIISGTLDIKGRLAALQGSRSAHYVIEKPVDVLELQGNRPACHRRMRPRRSRAHASFARTRRENREQRSRTALH
jgi:CheY-like chemotaxis protein